MTVVDALQADINDVYWGEGLDNGLSPKEYVARVKEAADVWLQSNLGEIAWEVFDGGDEAAN